MNSFFSELRRRNVYKVAVAYAVVGWLLVQIATQTFPFFDVPHWAIRLVILLVVIGFPVALVMAWAFELTPEGLKRTESVTETQPKLSGGRTWIYVVIAGCFLSIALFFLGRYTAPLLSGDGRPGGPSLPFKSIAVLPFENRSEDKANAYFADGIQDEILARLAKIADLKVISRTSTQRYKSSGENLREIAKQLDVAHVLEGSVQKSGEHVRVTVQLIRSATDSHVWAETYDRKLTDIFAVESEIAENIARSLQAKLTPREQQAVAAKPTENPAAYDAYLRGIHFDSRPGQTDENQMKAVESFAEAVRLDPQFAQAWAALSRMHAGLYFLQTDVSPARKEAARSAAETATRLNPSSPETLLANSYYRYHIERDYEGARVLFEKIQREAPSNSEALAALARIARRQSRWNESVRFFEQASKFNPRDAHLFLDRAWTFSMLREHAATAEMIESALMVSPDDPEVLVSKARLLQMTGDLPAARAVVARIPTGLENKQADDVRALQLLWERHYNEAALFVESYAAKRRSIVSADGPFAEQFLGWIRLLAGDSDGARQAYQSAKAGLEALQQNQPRNPFVFSALAFTEAGLGNKEAALRNAEWGVSLLPAAEDPVFGPGMEEALAGVEAQAGEIERAITRIERLLTIPYGAFPATQASLRIDPTWDSLRSHPRFQKLVSGPEPKTIYK
jgi:TolB-like protein/Tfp pilus assembly protein PilF